ncbi:hypothetical protein DCO16_06910 [Polynucleobacter antarcticus]|uniref:Uncharacterized protein n=1 Tax=Polynucleobacter antarcticus TaxID=1743162 RepID=A0A6M9PV66_9BURK|nr:hypothetical protein DCO16_06910 [Polynucleobacter antarcticus]
MGLLLLFLMNGSEPICHKVSHSIMRGLASQRTWGLCVEKRAVDAKTTKMGLFLRFLHILYKHTVY